MTYKEFIKKELERAKLNDWFDVNGNSITATASRGFLKEMKLDIKRLVNCFLCVDIKELLAHVAALLLFLFSPVLFVPLLICRAYFAKKRAKKEMMKSYIKELDKFD